MSHPNRHLQTFASVRTRRIVAGLLFGALLPGIVRADAQADYASLFGDEEKKVLATSATRDDAAFAAKLLARANDLKDAPELQKLVLKRAVELGQKDADGLPTAVEAAKQLVTIGQGADKLEWRGKLVDLYAAQYKRATGAKRAEAGDFLLGVLQKEADELSGEGKYADAVKRLNEARDIARSIRSPRVDEFLSAAKDVQARQQTAEKYDKLRQRMEQQGGDVAMLEQVILGYLLEVGDAETAKKLAAGHPDKTWEKMIAIWCSLGGQGDNNILLDLSSWSRPVFSRATDSARVEGLNRLVLSLEKALASYPQQDATRLKMDAELESVSLMIAQSASGLVTADKIILINTHNNTNNDRGTLVANVHLFRGNKAIWSRMAVAVAWQAGSSPSTTISIPGVAFDRVRVEVVKWQGVGGGLDEIRVIKEGRNISTNAKTAASGFFDNRFNPSTVTDGIIESNSPKGYWLLPDGVAGWIDLVPTSRK